MAAKHDPVLEQQAKSWIQQLTGKAVNDMHADLKDGVALCELINKLQPGSVRKINNSKIAFMQIENIQQFIKGCKAYGVPEAELFMPESLFEAKNMPQVVAALHSLGGYAKKAGFSGPTIGLAVSDRNVRQFDEATLAAGRAQVSKISQGSVGGANQAGCVLLCFACLPLCGLLTPPSSRSAAWSTRRGRWSRAPRLTSGEQAILSEATAPHPSAL